MEFLEASASRKLSLIKEEIAEIHKQIDRRTAIHHDFISELDAQLHSLEVELKEIPVWNIHNQANPRRHTLETRINELKRERRLENVSHWRDQDNLKKEVRELMKEYREILKRKEFLRENLGGE